MNHILKRILLVLAVEERQKMNLPYFGLTSFITMDKNYIKVATTDIWRPKYIPNISEYIKQG